MRKFLLAGSMIALSMVPALAQSTAPNISYSVKKDAMTDANQSILIVFEENDTIGVTYVGLRCDGMGGYEVFLKTKNPLFTQTDLSLGGFPTLMYRIDSQPPRTLQTSPVTRNGELDYSTLTFSAGGSQAINNAFIAANKVTIRVVRAGQSNLDYRFPAKGYIAALNKVNRCK
ncbi:hypothetical protein ACFOPQ_01200 [Deinococcus antarcticus]|uniref:Uncharacterized protein n=1 Tax=Deinococcus antarcticus TaxID=1298767 RepID=A0ABV8A4F2_9DEIO